MDLRRSVPNAITSARLVLAAIFVALLAAYQYPIGPRWALVSAIVVFIVAAVSDWLDGMLARRWNVTSAFGRVMDPLCDKVLVLGAFAMLAGPQFVFANAPAGDPAAGDAAASSARLISASGVQPWMVVVMLTRELLVTAMRSELEGRGHAFGAMWSGKLKTITQLVAAPLLLMLAAFVPAMGDELWPSAGWRVRDVIAWAVVLVTAASLVPYVRAAMRAGRPESDVGASS